jgi:hypothetical protein
MKLVEEQLVDFLNIQKRNSWLHDKDVDVYIRKSRRYLGYPPKMIDILDIATISVKKQGKGRFTRFLSFVQDVYPGNLFVENVQTPRFANFFRRLGWQEWIPAGGTPESPCFYLLRK